MAFVQGNSSALVFIVLAAAAYVASVVVVTVMRKREGRAPTGIRPPPAVKIVAIDDEADILRLIRIKLSKEGFEVSTASNGDEGVSKVLAERPDVIIVDVMMPGKDGYQVVSEIKRRLKDEAPVAILLTSKAEEADMKKGLQAGADDYITKPFSPRELIERINVALMKGSRSRT